MKSFFSAIIAVFLLSAPKADAAPEHCYSDNEVATLQGTLSTEPLAMADGSVKSVWVLNTGTPVCITRPDIQQIIDVSKIQIVGSPPQAGTVIELTGTLSTGNITQGYAEPTAITVISGRRILETNSTTLELLRTKAEQGDAEAQYKLGKMYYEGKDISKDYIEAEKWLRKSAEQGNAGGQDGLGLLYKEGKGVEQNAAEAIKCYQKSAAQGFAKAQYNLGLIYYEGKDVPKDFSEAAKWYQKAAAQGFAPAQANLGVMYQMGAGVEKDNVKAANLYRESAENGDAIGELHLGLIYYQGLGVAKNYTEAAKWLHKSADQNTLSAETLLGGIYFQGDGVSKDYNEAVKWYTKAADQGDADSQFLLGTMYQSGVAVSKDNEQAIMWYRKAADQGNEDAKSALAQIKATQEQPEKPGDYSPPVNSAHDYTGTISTLLPFLLFFGVIFLLRKGGVGWGWIITGTVVVFIIANSGGKEKTPAEQACADDWKKCSDNSQMANNYNKFFDIQYACKKAATDMAKYGTPEFPSFEPFGTFNKGTDYAETGIVSVYEKNAKFQNGFGAMVHSTVECVYDLNKKEVVSVNINPN